MRVKEYLKRLFYLEKEAECLKRERETLLASTFKIPQLSDMKVQSTPTKTIEDTYIAIAEYSEAISKKEEELLRQKVEISRMIDDLEDANQRMVLRYRYTIGFSWEEVIRVMNYSEPSVHRIHSQALQAFEKYHKEYLDELFKHESK